MLKLFVLKRLDEAEYGECKGLVIRAINSNSARLFAEAKSNDDDSRDWRNPKLTSCNALKMNGVQAIILQSNQSLREG